jgi:parallel beta-helix repeat protein
MLENMRGKFVFLIILLLLLSCSSFANATYFETATSSTYPVHNLNTHLNYTTIQEAIDAPNTTKGDTIEVDTGTYYEHVIIRKSITLVGEARDTTIIDGNGTGPIIRIAANYVTVSNFTTKNAGTDISEMYSGNPPVCINEGMGTHDVKVENNVLLSAVWGILLHGVSAVNVSNNIISNIALYAIDLGASYGEHNRNVTISNNLIHDFESFGINIDGDSQYCSIVNNTVENGFSGIDLGSNIETLIAPSNNLVDGNILSNNIAMNLLVESREGSSQEGYTNTFRRNNLANTQYHNLVIWGYNLGSFMQDIDSSNTINNKRIYYLTNISGVEVDPDNYPDAGYMALVNSTNVTVKDLDLSGNNDGLLLVGSTNCTLTNITLGNNHLPVLVPTSEAYPGNYGGLNLFESDNNTMVNSKFYNDSYGAGLYHSDGNLFYHNSFTNNDKDVISDYYNPFQNISSGYFSTNSWDNGLEGNYWSQYNGTDTDRDGIGDVPYIIDVNNTDNHALMGTFSTFNVSLPHGNVDNVAVISNSTVSSLIFAVWLSSPHDGLQPGQPFIQLSATGQSGTVGFCRLMIPRTVLNSSSYVVLVDSQPVNATELPISNSTCVYLYFTYPHSTHEVIVTIPEFSSLILPLFMATTLLAVALCRRKHPV